MEICLCFPRNNLTSPGDMGTVHSLLRAAKGAPASVLGRSEDSPRSITDGCLVAYIKKKKKSKPQTGLPAAIYNLSGGAGISLISTTCLTTFRVTAAWGQGGLTVLLARWALKTLAADGKWIEGKVGSESAGSPDTSPLLSICASPPSPQLSPTPGTGLVPLLSVV